MRKLAMQLLTSLVLAAALIFVGRWLYVFVSGAAPPYWFVEFVKISALLIVLLGFLMPLGEFLEERKKRRKPAAANAAKPAENEGKVAEFPLSRE